MNDAIVSSTSVSRRRHAIVEDLRKKSRPLANANALHQIAGNPFLASVALFSRRRSGSPSAIYAPADAIAIALFGDDPALAVLWESYSPHTLALPERSRRKAITIE